MPMSPSNPLRFLYKVYYGAREKKKIWSWPLLMQILH